MHARPGRCEKVGAASPKDGGAPVGSRVLERVAVLRVQDAGLAGPQRRAVEDAVELDLVPLLRSSYNRLDGTLRQSVSATTGADS